MSLRHGRNGFSLLIFPLFFVAAISLMLPACRDVAGPPVLPQPPVARVLPKTLTAHGNQRVDEYYWLNERDSPEVIAYLRAEEAYREVVMASTESLQEALYREMVTRIPQRDQSVPYRWNGYYYYTRFEKDQEYRLYCRRADKPDAVEEILLDAPKLAEGFSFFDIGDWEVSPDNRLLAFSVDAVSRRLYTTRVRDLETGVDLPDTLQNTSGEVVWAADGRSFFYVVKDTTTLRPYLVRRHTLGGPSPDPEVFREDDVTFDVSISASKSRRFVFIRTFSTLTNETLVIPADRPEQAPRVFQPREKDLKYSVDHVEGAFYVLTNWQAKNFRVMEAPEDRTAKERWREIVPHREDVLLEEIEPFREYLVVQEREKGLPRLRVLNRQGKELKGPELPEADFVVSLDTNKEPDSTRLRYRYSSLTTPASVYEYDMVTGATKLLKRDEVLGGFEASNYRIERLFAIAADGVEVPISLVYRVGFQKDGRGPLLLYGYGSYGYSSEPDFRPSIISLLDRGFAYGIAHIRGGQEMGRWWYEDGKLLKKKNTFTDFIACAEHLVAEKYTNPDRLFARGGSAGGLLMGTVVNMRPDLFRGIVAEVPWVDVVTTMLDPSIPLTTSEFDEWGNPEIKEYYDYMLSYSPYDNVKPQDYPAMLVTTGLHDSQVQYFEPAKWVARLRARKTDRNPLLLYVNFSAGHGGASGRFEAFEEEALQLAFLLDLAGLNGTVK